MAVKIQAKAAQEQVPAPKHKPDLLQSVKEENPLTAEEQQAVDRMLEIAQELQPYLPLLKEQDQLKKKLCSVALEKYDALQPALLKGKKGVVEFDVEVRRREITNMHGLIGKLKEVVGGYDPLLELITVPLKVVDTYLTSTEAAHYLGLASEGSRKLASVRPRKE
jgi:hypothetical protein